MTNAPGHVGGTDAGNSPVVVSIRHAWRGAAPQRRPSAKPATGLPTATAAVMRRDTGSTRDSVPGVCDNHSDPPPMAAPLTQKGRSRFRGSSSPRNASIASTIGPRNASRARLATNAPAAESAAGSGAPSGERREEPISTTSDGASGWGHTRPARTTGILAAVSWAAPSFGRRRGPAQGPRQAAASAGCVRPNKSVSGIYSFRARTADQRAPSR